MKKALSIILSLVMLVTTFAMPTVADAKGNSQNTTNPVIDGFYADPDIDYFDHKYWIFPTTDGVNGKFRDENVIMDWWSNNTFSAFSSEDLVNWTNEGVVFDVKADNAQEAGKNKSGTQIGYSTWSDGFAWAPSIEKIGNKYYLFYVGNIKPEYLRKYAYWDKEKNDYLDAKAIGVAVADAPTGPYVDNGEPLFYGNQVAEYVFAYNDLAKTEYTVPSVIDPSVFVDTGVDEDEDGEDDIYVTFGNWTPMIAKIKVDGNKIEIDDSVFKPIKGILWGWWQPDDNGFMESIVVFKKDRKYYFTWSVAGTANIGYRVAYGTANAITSNVTYKGTLLQLDPDNGIYGTGHQSVLCNPVDGKYYICYHRLHNSAEHPLDNIDADGGVGYRGCDRETCIDEIEFDIYGNITSKPTHNGVKAVPVVHKNKETTIKYNNCQKQDTKTVICTECGKKTVTNLNKIKSHSYTATVSKAPTSSAKGTMKYKCKNCSYYYTKSIAALAKTSFSKVTANKKGFKITWKKVSSATGYQIQYSTNSSFKSATTVNITKNSTVSKSVTKLKAKKKYYIRIRTYRTINGKKYYSSWSSKKSVTTKK